MASRYWVGGNATWDATAGTKWATTSGGAGGAAVPTTADDVFFDANSGATAFITLAAGNCLTLDCTGFTGTLYQNALVTLVVAGNLFKLNNGMGYTAAAANAALRFTATTGTTLITTAGKTTGNITLDAVGGTFQLQDALTTVSGAFLQLNNGTFDANNQNVSIGALSSANSNVRTISLGSGTWTITNTTGNPWFTSTITNLTFNKGTATVIFAGTTGNKTFNNGGLTFNTVIVEAQTGAGSLTIPTCTLGGLTVKGPNNIILSGTVTLQSAPVFDGKMDAPIGLTSDTPSTIRTMSRSTGNVDLRGCSIRDLTFSGGATFRAYDSFDLKGTTGITIRPPIVVQPNYQLGI